MDTTIIATWIECIGWGLWSLMAMKVQRPGAPRWIVLDFYCSTLALAGSTLCYIALLLFGVGDLLWGLMLFTAGSIGVYALAAGIYALLTSPSPTRRTALAAETPHADTSGYRVRTAPRARPHAVAGRYNSPSATVRGLEAMEVTP